MNRYARGIIILGREQEGIGGDESTECLTYTECGVRLRALTPAIKNLSIGPVSCHSSEFACQLSLAHYTTSYSPAPLVGL